MTENFNLAIQLLIVGMSTVFLILGVVVGLGRLLIFFVNKYATPSSNTKMVATRSSNSMRLKKVAVLTAVVDHITENKGTISTIEKL